MSPSESSHSQVDATQFELRFAFDLDPHSVLPLKCVCLDSQIVMSTSLAGT